MGSNILKAVVVLTASYFLGPEILGALGEAGAGAEAGGALAGDLAASTVPSLVEDGLYSIGTEAAAGVGADLATAATPSLIEDGLFTQAASGAAPNLAPLAGDTAAGTVGSTAHNLSTQLLDSGIKTSSWETGAADSAAQNAAMETVSDKTAGNGLIDKFLRLDPNLQAGIAQGGLQGFGLAGAAVLQGLSAQKKAELEAELAGKTYQQKLDIMRNFVQSSSQGGKGVTGVPNAPAQLAPITTATGQPVYGTNGIIGRFS